MVPQVLAIAATALLSSLLTLAAVWWLYRRHLRRELDARLDAALSELDRRLEKALEALGAIVEERVRQGVLKGVASIPTTDVLTDTTRTVAKTSVELANKGLSALLGRRTKRPSE